MKYLYKQGHKQSVETRKKISKARMGIKFSEEHKKKLREARKGMKYSLERKQQMSKNQRGIKGSNWQGGITALAGAIRTSFKYRQWRSDVFTRDNFTCQICGLRGSLYLHAHHKKDFSKILKEYNITTLEMALNCEELWNINNGKTVCKKCHKKTDSYLKRWPDPKEQAKVAALIHKTAGKIGK